MTYRELLADLSQARRFGMQLGLERMEAALARRGHAERRMGAILHVGGTNGKGSTAAMLEAMLGAAGYRTGLYTSPHLARFTERVRIAGAEVDPAVLVAQAGAASDPEALTFFERATLLAIGAFADAGTEVVILEVGLGGRLDATNAVLADVAVLTGIGRDHEDVLGEGLAAIAREKAGICKPGRPAVIGPGEGRALLVREAQARGAEVILADGPVPFAIGLRGAHQEANAACALAALDALAMRGPVTVPEPARRDGLARVRWPGRLEELPGGIWLDAAHNPDGARALAGELARLGGRWAGVVGISADKDAEGIVAPLWPYLGALVVTRAPADRAVPAAELGARLARLGPHEVEVEEDPRAALDRARASGAERVIVFGSIFLVGAVRAALLGEAMDDIGLTDPREPRG